jgi:hypothetical protein
MCPRRYSTARPEICTQSPWFSQKSSPLRRESCGARSVFLPRLSLQYGTNVQWDEPVTGSSGIPAPGAKNRDTKSQSFPDAEQSQRRCLATRWPGSLAEDPRPLVEYRTRRADREPGILPVVWRPRPQQWPRRTAPLRRSSGETHRKLFPLLGHGECATLVTKDDVRQGSIVVTKQDVRARQRGMPTEVNLDLRGEPPQPKLT